MTGKAWRTLNRKYTIKTGYTVPYQQQQNYAESRGGNFKFAVCKMMHLVCLLLFTMDGVKSQESSPKE